MQSYEHGNTAFVGRPRWGHAGKKDLFSIV